MTARTLIYRVVYAFFKNEIRRAMDSAENPEEKEVTKELVMAELQNVVEEMVRDTGFVIDRKELDAHVRELAEKIIHQLELEEEGGETA